MHMNAPMPTATLAPTGTPALDITDLRFRFNDGPWLIEVPRLTLEGGEQLLLQAPSGRGKSTLMHLIAGITDLRQPNGTGTIRIAGRNIHALHGAARDGFRGRSIGMIFQTFNLLQGFTALENIMAALMFSDLPAAEHQPRALELLAKLSIDRTGATPDQLSVGQQQRVAVARAVACRPALVLADEPTASLDPLSGRVALDLIQEVCRESNAALLLVSHDPTIASRFARCEELGQLSRHHPANSPATVPA